MFVVKEYFPRCVRGRIICQRAHNSYGIVDAVTGTCVASASIIYASPSGGDAAPCTMAAPCSITHAFAVIDTVRSTIRLLPGNYIASLVTNGKTVTVDGFGAMLTAASGSRALEIQDGSHVRIFGLSVVDLNLGDPGIALGCETTSGGLAPIVELDQVSLDSAYPAVRVSMLAHDHS